MSLRYQISTLLYCFNRTDEVLLLERTREPNRGLWSPPGGKLEQAKGESPYASAARETLEEVGVRVEPSAFHLAGIVSEHGYGGAAHWLMFLFELKPRLEKLPPVHPEGRFQFFKRTKLESLALPQTDREMIWPLFWKHRGGFFAAHCHCHSDKPSQWTLEESLPPFAG